MPDLPPSPGGRLTGLGVSQGRAAGPVIRMAAPATLPPPRPVTDPGAEASTVAKALEAVAADLNQRATAARRSPSTGIPSTGATGTAAAASAGE
ncbi:phosphoenolpyruvate-utilizing N-terminal domain-containing protein, partial [Nonomuraea sp. NPDC049784]|uniref:phosphoenolpyruvate-utilizing N-terminal domain-containing protein n=1 Tax=Nonomuraea sp. NPDC049784 TaxID=3154361 RepID=UPI0033F2CDEB